MAIRSSTLEMERRVQTERAKRAAGELTEALRVITVVTDPAKPNRYDEVERLHDASQTLTAAIMEKL